MKKKNGFTLIELLAVIVILAIIALIATPIVLNLIEKARQGAAKDSAYGVRKSAQLYYQKSLIDNPNGLSDDVTVSFNNGVITLTNGVDDNNFELDGTKPSGGSIIITKDGEVSGTVIINGYTCTIPSVGKVDCTKGNSGTTPSESEQAETTPTPIVTPEEPQATFGGTIDTATQYSQASVAQRGLLGVAYLDPSNLTAICNANSEITTTPTGCKKFYIFDDSNDKYTMIMDRNTTTMVAYNTTTPYVAYENASIKTQVEADTAGWVGSPRLITANELVTITNTTTFDGSKDTWFYFNGTGDNKQTPASSSQGDNEYAWLFDYTNICESYGCNAADSSTYGYWTSSPVSDNQRRAWYVHLYGRLYPYNIDNSSYCGVRPVITLDKSIFN